MLHPEHFHEVQHGARRLLFHAPTASLFDADPLVGAVLGLLRDGADPATLVTGLRDRFPQAELDAVVAELALLDASAPATPASLAQPAPAALVLALTSGCNLACSYCYKEDLTRPGAARRMTESRACEAVDLLMRVCGPAPLVTVTFFGGEPLLELPLIRRIVAYAEAAAARDGKQVAFALTTNAMLLDDAAIDFLDAHRFGITVSIDGPATLHDRHRRTAGGQGSYATVATNLGRLLQRKRSRPVGARVTLAAGCTDVAGIHAHLHDQLGFTEIGFAPVTAGTAAAFCLDDADLAAVFAGFHALGRRWRDAAIAGHDIGFANIANLVAALHKGAPRELPCGAGTRMLAADADGALHLCHRFVGSDGPTFGSTEQGIDAAAVRDFVARALFRAAAFCTGCIARPVCAGGCYHESYARHGDLFRPTDHYCELIREWVRFGIGVMADIKASNPGFLAINAQPRRAAT